MYIIFIIDQIFQFSINIKYRTIVFHMKEYVKIKIT